MAKSIELTKKQREAIDCIAVGMTQNDTAAKVGVSRPTIARWVSSPAFREEVERRKEKAKIVHQEESDRIQREETRQFYEDLAEYKKSVLATYKARISRGLKIMQKAGRRLDDLPDEALQPKDIAALLNVSDSLLAKGYDQWAELLAIDELLTRLNGEQGSSK